MWIESTLTDVAHTFRSMRKRPIFALSMLFTFALGLGATTAVLTVVHAVLIRPFPFPDSDRIVEIQTVSMQAEGNVYGCSFKDADDIEERLQTLDSVGTYQQTRVNLIPEDRAIPARVTRITPGFFDVLGARPMLGRTFVDDEDRPGGDVHKAVLSHAAWQTIHGGRRDIIGRTIRTAMGDYVVEGVMPAGIVYPPRTDFWVPIQSHYAIRGMDRSDPRHRGARYFYRAIARLSSSATLQRGQAELDPVSAQLRTEHAERNRDFAHRIVTLREAETGALRPYLLLLLGAVVVVLGICCTNIASLLLSRTASRARELGLRAVLGAGRARLTRQLLTESVLYAILGSGLGVLVAWAALRAFAILTTDVLPAWARLDIDVAILAASFLIALVSGLVVGLAALVHLLGSDSTSSVREGSRSAGRTGILRPAMVVAEVGLSVVLLTGALLLLSSVERLQRVDTGIDAERVLTVSMSAYRPGTNEERIRGVTAYYRRVIEKLQELPGVVAVGGTDNFPYGSRYSSARNENRFEARGDSEDLQAHRAKGLLVDVTPDYFQAMGVPLLEGRTFTEGDTLDAPWVIMLSDTGARTLFPDRPALGQELRITYDGGGADPWARVVGIVGDVKYTKREDDTGIEIYYPYTQYGLSSTTLAIRTRGPTEGLQTRVREIVQGVDPETAVERVSPLAGMVGESLWLEHLWGTILFTFAAVALVLAAIGIYGVVSIGVAARTREIGLRMALGSTPRQVLALVTREGMRLVALGVAMGLGAASLLVPFIRSLLFQAEAIDFAAYALPALVLVAVGLAACIQPSIRASRIQPVRALSQD